MRGITTIGLILVGQLVIAGAAAISARAVALRWAARELALLENDARRRAALRRVGKSGVLAAVVASVGCAGVAWACERLGVLSGWWLWGLFLCGVWPLAVVGVAVTQVGRSRRILWDELRAAGVEVCLSCGYDCRAIDSERCPECGAVRSRSAGRQDETVSTDIETWRGPRMTVMYRAVHAFITQRAAECDQIEPERRAALDTLCQYIRDQQDASKCAQLLFVCTHNSRRSQMAQIWATVAAEHFGLHVRCYSGGTETTAVAGGVIDAMQRAGFVGKQTTQGPNPTYEMRYSDDRPPLTCFSKTYGDSRNPADDFAAVMVCDDADKNCPVVRGATGRFAIPYSDPKVADGTPRESATYDKSCEQIAREMLYVMSRVRK